MKKFGIILGLALISNFAISQEEKKEERVERTELKAKKVESTHLKTKEVDRKELKKMNVRQAEPVQTEKKAVREESEAIENKSTKKEKK